MLAQQELIPRRFPNLGLALPRAQLAPVHRRSPSDLPPGGMANVRRFLSWTLERDPLMERISKFRAEIASRRIRTDSVVDVRELRDSE